MALYHFVTEFALDAAPERVWDLILRTPTWLPFWRWLRRVDVLEPGRPDGTGARYRLVIGTALPYALTFEGEAVRVVPRSRYEARTTGDLEGTGLWELSQQDGGSRLRYTWIVAPTKRWMNLLAPIARPAFSWNHALVMRGFAAGLARELGCRLAFLEHRTLRPDAPGFGRLRGAPVS
jgi:hypothetical protein